MSYNHSLSPETLGKLLLFDADSGVLTWRARGLDCFASQRDCKIWNTRYAGKQAICISRGYAMVRVLGQRLCAHRVGWAIHHGRWPIDQLDHIDGDTLNNAIYNLREVSNAINSRNIKLPVNNSSGRIGVSRHPRGWRAEICIDQRRYHLGVFSDFEDACQARQLAEVGNQFHINHGRQGYASSKDRKKTKAEREMEKSGAL